MCRQTEVNKTTDPPSCIELLRKFEEKQKLEKQKSRKPPKFVAGKMLPIELGSKYARMIVYNPSAPFPFGGRTLMCGRAEYPDAYLDSQVLLLEECADRVWRPADDSPVLPLEDGFAVQINEKETIIGGVKAYSNPTAEHPDNVDYHTVFYTGCEPKLLREFARGPFLMKDIRFIVYPDGHIMAFTRPHGVIACMELSGLDGINPETLLQARVIENQFAPGEWGGANQLFFLSGGRIGVLGHIAYMDEERNRHYYAMTFVYDKLKHQTTPIEIIACRDDFPPGEAKAPDLRDVVFPGGMVRHGNGKSTLYAGLGDRWVGCMTIDDPFWQYEIPKSEMIFGSEISI